MKATMEPPTAPTSPVATVPLTSSGSPAESHGMVLPELASMHPSTILDSAALACALKTTERTLRRMVKRFELPPPVRFRGKKTWMAGKVLAWHEGRAERLAAVAKRTSDRLAKMREGDFS